MAGLGKMLKQAARAQQQIQAVQAQLGQHRIEITRGGGAVAATVDGHGDFVALRLDPEFLKEDAKFVEETVLDAVREAAKAARAHQEAEMRKATAGFQMPGLM